MGGALFQYGTAVHLALLTVAPLFLSVFCEPVVEALVLFWLSLFGAIWIVMNPSPRHGEWPRDARHRICLEIGHDPLLILFVVALILSFVRAVNIGVGQVYDTATKLWVLKGPVVSVLPGSVTENGVLPLAGAIALSVVVLGVRHALGSRARLAYLLAASILAAFAVAYWEILRAHGVALAGVEATATNPFPLTDVLGVFLLFALVACVECWKQGTALLELLAAIVASAVLFGFAVFATPFAKCTVGALALIVTLGGIALAGLRRTAVSWLHAALILTVVVAPLVLWVTSENRLSFFWPLFPEGFQMLRDASSAVATEAWRGSTQLGVGLGAFPAALGFFASPEDWQVISPFQTAAPHGWIHFLFERGVLGAVVLLTGLGLLLKDIVVRFLRAGDRWSLSAVHLLGVAVLLSAVTAMFVDCTFTQLEMLSPVGASLALTAAALPDPTESDHG